MEPWHRISAHDPESGTAICSVCGPTEVRVRTSGRTECRTQWRKHNYETPAAKKRRARNARGKQRCGPRSLEEIGAAIELQNGLCAICGTKPKKTLLDDHCHETGKPRGMLCGRCNWMLGLARDNVDILEQSVTYLNKYRESGG